MTPAGKPTAQIQWVDINSIQPYPNNPRKNRQAITPVMDSIEKYGFQQPIVVDGDMTVIVGHTRLAAAGKLGLAQVPILVADLTPEQSSQYRVMDNKSGEYSEWDYGLLKEEFKSLWDNPWDHLGEISQSTGFTATEIKRMFPMTQENVLEEAANKPPPVTQPGDLWTLGDHRVLCGSSTDPAQVARVMAGEKIHLLWEDPPYGISYATPQGMFKTAEHIEATRRDIKNDELTGDNLQEFLEEHLRAVTPHLMPGGAVYWAHDIRMYTQFRQALENNQIHIADTLIWRKNTASNFLSDYAKYYEPIFYGWKKGAEHRWFGTGWHPNAEAETNWRDMTHEQLVETLESIDSNYQQFKKSLKDSKMHPTVKPWAMIAYHITNSSQRDENVFDGFGGSGSTLIAAHKTRRRARLIEMEPHYVDVIVKRWQELTLQEAVDQNGVTFSERSMNGPAQAAPAGQDKSRG